MTGCSTCLTLAIFLTIKVSQSFYYFRGVKVKILAVICLAISIQLVCISSFADPCGAYWCDLSNGVYGSPIGTGGVMTCSAGDAFAHFSNPNSKWKPFNCRFNNGNVSVCTRAYVASGSTNFRCAYVGVHGEDGGFQMIRGDSNRDAYIKARACFDLPSAVAVSCQ